MSRSNPNESLPHPCTRWFEWSSKNKCIKYYDREKEENVLVKLPFTFLLLDEMSVVRGYNKKLKDGIISNEVRNTKTDPLNVRFFNNGAIAFGLWDLIKEKCETKSGKYHKNLYIAYVAPEDKTLKIGSLMLGGCSMGEWFEFTKKCKKVPVEIDKDGKKTKIQAIYAKAICITGFKSDTSGDIEFNAPVYKLSEVKPETAVKAVALDQELQVFLQAYCSKPLVAPKGATPDPDSQHSPADGGSQEDAPGDGSESEKEPTPEPEQEGDTPF